MGGTCLLTGAMHMSRGCPTGASIRRLTVGLQRHFLRGNQIMVLLACVTCVCGPVSANEQDAADAASDAALELSRDTVVTWFRTQEELVKSMECQFETRASATAPDMVPLIREVCRIRGEESDYTSYVITEERALARSNRTHYWRNGPMQREEVFQFDAHVESPTKIRAFDGRLVRTLERTEKGSFGHVGLPETEHWDNVNWTHPFSFLYQFTNQPYSQIIDRARELTISAASLDGKNCTRISFLHPTIDRCWFVLFVDDEHRLVERQHITMLNAKEPRVHERHVFSDYRAFEDADGKRIWFPHRADYYYYMGTLSDGRLAEWTRESITVHEIRFNMDIAEEQFAQNFPENTTLHDSVTHVLLREEGPLTMGLLNANKLTLKRGTKTIEIYAWIGGTSPISGQAILVNHAGLVPLSVHPVAEIEFPHRDATQTPIRVEVTLDQRC